MKPTKSNAEQAAAGETGTGEPRDMSHQNIVAIARTVLRQNRELVKLLEAALPPEVYGFVPTPLQQRILVVLDGLAIYLGELHLHVGCSRHQLNEEGGFYELIDLGRVGVRSGRAYRPDRPPPEGIVDP